MLKIKLLNYPRLVIFLLICVPLYLLYLSTASKTVYWQDAPLFILAIKTHGIMHPPGFPLYLMLSKVWVDFWIFVTNNAFEFPYYVHTFSALWGTLASFWVGLSIYELVGIIKFRKITKIGKVIISSTSGLFIGTSYSLWNQSINAEVFSFLGFFSAIILFLIIRIIKVSKNDQKPFHKKKLFRLLILLFSVWGLSLSNHPATILFLPAIIYLLYRFKLFPGQKIFQLKAWILLLALFALFFLIPYLYIPLRSKSNPIFMWEEISSLKSMIDYLLGRIYFVQSDSFRLFYSNRIASYPELFYNEFFTMGLVLGLFGIIFIGKVSKSLRHLTFITGILFLTNIIFLSIYQRGYEYNYYLINFYVVWAIFVGIGLTYVIYKLNINKVLLGFILINSLLIPQIVINYPILNRSNYKLAQEYGINILNNLPKNSVLFVFSDHESAMTSYLREVVGFRKDIILLRESYFNKPWMRRRIIDKYPELEFSKDMASDKEFSGDDISNLVYNFIDKNLDNRDIFLSSKNAVGLVEKLNLVPAGALWQVIRNDKDKIVDISYWNYDFSDPFRYEKNSRAEPERAITSREGEIVGRYKTSYMEEALNFEARAAKELFLLCYESFIKNNDLIIVNPKNEVEVWGKDKLISCANKSYNYYTYLKPISTGGFSMSTNYTLWTIVNTNSNTN